MQRKLKYHILIFIFCFAAGFFSSPPYPISSLFLCIRNLCMKFFYSQQNFFDILKSFTVIFYGRMYKLSGYLSCLTIKWFSLNILPHKILSSFFFGVFGVTLYIFLKTLSRDEKLSFLSAILTLILPPVLYYSGPLDFSTLIGPWLVFLLSLLFFTERRNLVIYLLILIAAFLSAFANEHSRLFALPFLLFLFFLYPERRGRNRILLGSVFFFTLVSLTFHLVLAKKSISPIFPSLKGVSLSVVYYSHFIVCYYLYCYGYIGCLLFISSFIRFLSPFLRKFVSVFLFLLGFTIVFFSPVYTYGDMAFDFFFVTPSIPWSFFLLALTFLISATYSTFKTQERWEAFSFLIFLAGSSIILFVMGIFPRIRNDSSARHLLVVFPFFSLLLVKTIKDFIKNSKTRIWISILIIAFVLRNFAPLITFISMMKDPSFSTLGYQLRSFFLRERQRAKENICVYYLTPQYYIVDPQDIIYPWINKVITFQFVRPISLEKLPKKNCEKVFGIYWRFKPLRDPFYLPPGQAFFEHMKAFLPPFTDQWNIASFSYMHTPSPLPLEQTLQQYPLVFKAESTYYSLPLFYNELLHRLWNKIPFFLKYKYYFHVYILNRRRPLGSYLP